MCHAIDSFYRGINHIWFHVSFSFLANFQIIYKTYVFNTKNCKRQFFNFSLHIFRMFPFVSILPSQSIVLRRWHRRRSRKSHDSCSSKIFHSISAKSQHLQHITFFFTLALVFTLTHGKKYFKYIYI